MYNVKDIDTKGYAVIKNFLSMEEAETYHAQFDSIDKEQYKFNDIYKIIMSRNNIQSVKDKLQTLTECINQQTGSTTNLVDKNVEFASSKLLNFSWHQEHEAYHMLQSFKDFFTSSQSAPNFSANSHNEFVVVIEVAKKIFIDILDSSADS